MGNISITPYGKTRVMGIINVSPESFYKGSIIRQEDDIQDTIIRMQDQGVDIVDVGGMSTAPYLKTLVPKDLESKRLHNAISAIRQISNIPISVDTARSDVIRSLLKLEVNAINDVTGLKYDKKMPGLAYEHDLPVILGAYLSDRENLYGDGDIQDTSSLLAESIRIAKKSKIDDDKLIIDPSIGFFRKEGFNQFYSKTQGMDWYVRDIDIIANIKLLTSLKKPICVSISRKSFIGSLFGLDVEDRLIPSIIAEMYSVMKGASLLRTHNVKETRQAIEMLEMIR
ncbi:dihydropteroate synthase [Candidatus Nitrosocosmicus arcticus]|uniref:dihydropteroate synthase n=1 Tax=Candidatus Nitrosocosmicus arcticus TaxID=2035267 RepID=UPI00164516B9|nr:dihydropteroate synthase [Candidatus Nitrosocosmicus arcticus]